MAARIYTVAQQKGGAGKTTLAAHLAVAWAMAGLSTAVVDIDPQGSLSEWMRLRLANQIEPVLGHLRITGWRTQKEVEQLARDHQIVVIDSPPHAETEARLAVRAADLVVVPVQPSPMDLWATQPTISLAEQEKVPLVLVMNRVASRAKMTEDLIAQVSALRPGLVADTLIGNRVAFAGAMMDGRTAMETARSSLAAHEMQTLATELLERVSTVEQARQRA